ncbi:MAG: hypothetical protein WD431_20180 [Cyclobacteriaceae bacterium]
MKNINRRDWLKTSVLGLGSMSLLSPSLTAGTPTTAVKAWSNESMLWEMNLIYNEVKMKARLLANENPFGPSRSVQKAIAASIQYEPDHVLEK